MPTDKEPARSTPKILVGGALAPVGWGSTEGILLSSGPTLTPDPQQALCFAGVGFLLMTMSLSFIIIDWVSGTSQRGGNH